MMSGAPERTPVRSPRRFSSVDDAFTDAPPVGESRTLTLAELEAELALAAPVQLPAGRPVPEAAAAQEPEQGGLLTLAELGEVLAQPAPAADVLDFDFGSGAEARARRRTQARTGTALRVPRARGLGARSARPERLARRRAACSGAPDGPGRPCAGAAELRAPGADGSVARRPLPGSAALQRARADPDRIALYAVLLGILLVLIAATSSASGA